MVATIAGLANRRSWSMLPAASPEPGCSRTRFGYEANRNERRPEAALSETIASRPSSVKRSRFDTLRPPMALTTHRVVDPGFAAVATKRALQQVLAEQAGSAGANAQPSGNSSIVPGRLTRPSSHCAEHKEAGGSEAGGADGGIRQTDLLGRDYAGVRGDWGCGSVATLAAPEYPPSSDLVFSGTLYLDMLPAGVSSLLEFFLVCRGRIPAAGKRGAPRHGLAEVGAFRRPDRAGGSGAHHLVAILSWAADP